MLAKVYGLKLVFLLQVVIMSNILTYFQRKKRKESHEREQSPHPPLVEHHQKPSTSTSSPCPSSEQLNSLMSVDCDVNNDLDEVTSLPSDHVEAQLVESDSEDNPNPLLATSSTNRSIFFDNKRAPHRPYLKSYPKKKQGDRNRSINPKLYQDYKWLEYCEECDACFCFACRVFLSTSKEESFTSAGFNDWKHSSSKGKGLPGHDGCKSHDSATKSWDEQTEREKDQ